MLSAVVPVSEGMGIVDDHGPALLAFVGMFISDEPRRHALAVRVLAYDMAPAVVESPREIRSRLVRAALAQIREDVSVHEKSELPAPTVALGLVAYGARSAHEVAEDMGRSYNGVLELLRVALHERTLPVEA